MTDRYEQLSDRARWYLNNFDEIDLADICASQEASNRAREETIERVRTVAGSLSAMGGIVERTAAIAIHHALGESAPAHDTGPSVQEAAADDRRYWDVEREGQ
ncbi:hypothetical protein [Streptomyces sp. NPDC050534]|uniref:hypothetical protein n=1 Tax=Streptomyces sp. NPDC050534 TaxID=3365625 RepID=UPI0037B76F8E